MITLEHIDMRSFECNRCGHGVAFDASSCGNCTAQLGYFADEGVVRALPSGDITTGANGWLRCLNAAWGCNWMVPIEENESWCRSCRLTRSRPDVGRPDAIEAWMRAESAKRRLIHQLDTLGLPVDAPSASVHGLVFDLIHIPGEAAVTGHRPGVITLDLLETDEAHRDALRHQLDESFRTVMGHLRHEIGHHYWDRLVGQTDHLDRFRRLFGDERADYGAALDDHYARSGPSDDDPDHISGYAASHPMEDWAETFAHYLHILDAVDTASAAHLTVADHPTPAAGRSIDDTISAWRAIASAVNAIAGSLGHPPLYPFELSGLVVEKLRFVHERIGEHAERTRFYSTPA